jgi:hypothetical protein
MRFKNNPNRSKVKDRKVKITKKSSGASNPNGTNRIAKIDGGFPMDEKTNITLFRNNKFPKH